MHEIVREPPSIVVFPSRILSQSTWQLLGIWFAVRCFTWMWAALVSMVRPSRQLEQIIPIWPPTTPIARWLERVFISPWDRWDVSFYVFIVERGYQKDDGTAQFHPLLAWLAIPVAWLTDHPPQALLVVSALASIFMFIAFERLAGLDLQPADARASLLLFISCPVAFILFAPYTESLFLLWAVACFYGMRQRSWWLAGLAGGLAVLTRQQGLFLVFPLAWELWEAAERKWRRALARWRDWLALLFIVLGLAVWLVYRAVALGDLRASFADPQALIYSLLISPSASKVVPVQAFLPPWQALWLALAKLWREPELSLVVDLLLGAGFLVLLAFAWRNLRLSYRIYTAVIVLVSFGYYTGPVFPYMGLPRHLLLAFPVFIGLGARRLPWYARHLLLAGGLLASSFLLLLYVTESWTP